MPTTVNVENKTVASASDDSSKFLFATDSMHTTRTTGFDSGVVVESTSEIEHVLAERESELDLSRILSELSPLPQVIRNTETQSSAQLPSNNEVCELRQDDEQSHEGSEDESPATNRPPNEEIYTQEKQHFDGAANSSDSIPSSPPFLEPYSAGNLQFGNHQDQSTSANIFPPFPSLPPLSSYAHYGLRTPLEQDPMQTFQTSSHTATTSQTLQNASHQNQQITTIQREPNNQERIAFLRGCSPATLWHFVLDCLSRPAHYNNVCAWTTKIWEFCITHTKRFTEKWDIYNRNKQAVSYVKVSRALKSFESTQFCGLTLLRRVSPGRNTFRFLPDHNSSNIPHIEYDSQVSLSTVECLLRQRTSFPTTHMLFNSAQSCDSEATGNNCYSNIDISPPPRMPPKRPFELCSTESQPTPAVKSYRLDEGQSPFPPQMQDAISSTPLRGDIASLTFGQELTNISPWSYQYSPFPQAVFPSGSNQWTNYSPSMYQPSLPFWGYPNGPIPYQVPDENAQSCSYGTFTNRTPVGFFGPRNSTYPGDNQLFNYSSANSSNDSAFYDDTRSMQSFLEPAHYSSSTPNVNSGREAPQGDVHEGYSYRDSRAYH